MSWRVKRCTIARTEIAKVIMWSQGRCIVISPASNGSRCLGSRELSLQFSSVVGQLQRRRRSWTATTTRGLSGAQRLPLVISRRAVQEQKQKLARDLLNKSSLSKPKSLPPIEDLPWPRNIVRAAYVFAAIAVPYTLAWLVSTNATLRSLVIPARILNEATQSTAATCTTATTTASSDRTLVFWSVRLVQALRRHFGVTDWESLSEPEAVDLQYSGATTSTSTTSLPHRFVDEPTAHIRRQQAWLQDWLDTSMIAVRFHAPTAWSNVDNDNESNTMQCTLPATTLARHDVLQRAVVQSTMDSPSSRPPFLQLPLVAIDFPEPTPKDETEVLHGTSTIDSEFQTNEINDGSQTGSSTSMSLSIYSPWHYHAPPPSPQPSSSSSTSAHKSRAQVEAEWHVARLDHEIAQLHAELQSGATYKSIDDLHDQLRRKQKERFQWQCKKWMGISW
jgi:hypothetical protein